MRKGGDSGPAVVPGKSEESLLIEAVTGRRRLADAARGRRHALSRRRRSRTLRAWIDQGADGPGRRAARSPTRASTGRSGRRSGPPCPRSRRPRAWVRNPIDAFLAAEHEQRGPRSAPARRTRRAAPPRLPRPDRPGRRRPRSCARSSPTRPTDAYEKVVDRLLASPQYGERWGRHWMDVWRYSDWDGFGAEVRESQPHIWRWRDWIVESLNADKGYDRMVVEMLAADEAAPDDPDALRATGFLVRNWYKFNRNVWLRRHGRAHGARRSSA